MVDKKIVFQCHGGHHIGWGHVMRCLNLAQWLKGKYKVYFVINQDAEICEFIRGKGFPVFEVGERKNEKKSEEKIINTVLSLEPHLVINDVRDTTQEYMQTLKMKNIKIINFDDTSNNVKMANAFIDANKKEKNGKCFGPSFIVLSSMYSKIVKKKRKIHKKVRTILVSLGGSDPQYLTDKTMRSFEGKITEPIEIKIIIGPSFHHKDRLEKWGRLNNVSFVKEYDDLSTLLLNADIAVVNGGITMFESLCVGTPTVVIAQNKPQAKNARRMERRGAVINLGEGTKISDKKIARKVNALINSFTLRDRLSHKAKKEIDGKGIFRVLEQVELLL